MTTEEFLPGLLTPEPSLHRLADDLSARFSGVFARLAGPGPGLTLPGRGPGDP